MKKETWETLAAIVGIVFTLFMFWAMWQALDLSAPPWLKRPHKIKKRGLSGPFKLIPFPPPK